MPVFNNSIHNSIHQACINELLAKQGVAIVHITTRLAVLHVRSLYRRTRFSHGTRYWSLCFGLYRERFIIFQPFAN